VSLSFSCLPLASSNLKAKFFFVFSSGILGAKDLELLIGTKAVSCLAGVANKEEVKVVQNKNDKKVQL
jgi:hypothetical protein